MFTASATSLHPSFGAQRANWLHDTLASVRALFTMSRAPSAAPKPQHQQQAEKLREAAVHVMRVDPAFAKDLLATANRHEFGELA